MATSKTTDYAEIAAGFVRRFGFIGPLVAFAMPTLKLTVAIKLTKPERNIFVDLGAKPISISVDGPPKQGDVTLTLDAEMFHYLLWGKMTFPKALNEGVLLLEIKSGSLPDIPVIEPPRPKVPRAPGVNPIYEMYLVNIGAGHLLDEKVELTFPPQPHEQRSIELGPSGKTGMIEKTAQAFAWTLGLVAGLFLRMYLRLRKPPKFKPPEIKYLTFDEVFKPLPPAKNQSITRLPFGKALSSNMDILRVMESGVSGLGASGALKKPLDIFVPLTQKLNITGLRGNN